MNVYTTYTRPLSVRAQYSRKCPIFSSYCYNSSLVTWTVVCLTAAKFKPRIFSVSGFALSNVANCSQLQRDTRYIDSARTTQKTRVTCQTACSLGRYQHWAWRGPHRKHFFQYPFYCWVRVFRALLRNGSTHHNTYFGTSTTVPL
jgi:hypothetical protein